MGIIEMKKAKFEKETAHYRVSVHPQTNRLYHIQLSKESIAKFLDAVSQENFSVQHLEYTPYARHLTASYFIRSGRRRVW